MLIAVTSKSTAINPAVIQAMTAACQIQLERDVAPAWGMVPFEVKFFPKEIPKGSIRMVIFDSADQAGALGYHSDGPDGLPYGRVFTKPVLTAGGKATTGDVSVSSVLSHEVIELFADPECNRWADGLDGTSYAFELCDPVEADSYSIKVADQLIAVSNFVLPAWFDQRPPRGAKFDFLGKLSRPFTMTAGGYVVHRKYGGEKETFAHLALEFGENYPDWKKPGKTFAAARTARRDTGTKKLASSSGG